MSQSTFSTSLFNPGAFSLYQEALNPLDGNAMLDELFELVPLAEELGFKRYWLAEHYDFDVGWRNAHLLMSVLAGMTSRIKLGSAGVLLRMYQPMLIAQDYKMLEYLYSGRIDLGLAKGIAPPNYHQSLGFDDLRPELFGQKVDELIGWFKKGFDITAEVMPPYHHDIPELWFLGAGDIPLAIKHKGNLCLSIFHKYKKDGYDPELPRSFKAQYFDKWGEKPKVSLAVGGICLESDEEAQALHSKYRNTFFVPNVVGGYQTCFEKISALAEYYDVDEVVFMDLLPDTARKIESYHMLSEVFNLKKTISE